MDNVYVRVNLYAFVKKVSVSICIAAHYSLDRDTMCN